MADTIQARQKNQDYIHQLQMEQAEKKKELMSQQRDELRALKEKYQEENKKLDHETSAAISHIKMETIEEQRDYQQKVAAERAMYNRQGQKANAEQKKTSAQSQNVQRKSTFVPDKSYVQRQEAKENDSFYHVVDRGSQLKDDGDQYIIEAYAPAHEKDNLKMSIQNNRAILSGNRKFEDSVDQGNKKISTNNLQTFHEEFRFDRPVSTEGLRREREGDFVRFFIPKLESYRFDEES